MRGSRGQEVDAGVAVSPVPPPLSIPPPRLPFTRRSAAPIHLSPSIPPLLCGLGWCFVTSKRKKKKKGKKKKREKESGPTPG